MSDEMLSIEGVRVEAVTPNGSASSSGQPLVDDITLSLARGEVLGLIGESGAGKTTIGLAAMGYARPGCRVTSGRVVFESHDLATLSSAQLRALRGSRIAYVAQSAAASLNPAIPLGTQVAETMVMTSPQGGEPRARRPRGYSPSWTCPRRRLSARATRIKSPVASCSAR
jgi:peptide/nickel transport system ATP-binding protein